jgi:hypothetical protein
MANKLTILQFQNNMFSGRIPPNIGNSTQLYTIRFDQNQFTGPIPKTIGNSINLLAINFADNQLTSSIPETIGNLLHLYQFSVSNNLLTGSIPEEIMIFKEDFNNFYVDHNLLSYSLPDQMFNFSYTTYLYLDNNRFTGELPFVGNMPNLESLYLSDNYFQGNFLTAIPLLSNSYPLSFLSVLNISENELYGLIPEDLHLLSKRLIYLSLSSNYLSGDHSSGLSFTTSIKHY